MTPSLSQELPSCIHMMSKGLHLKGLSLFFVCEEYPAPEVLALRGTTSIICSESYALFNRIYDNSQVSTSSSCDKITIIFFNVVGND